MFTHPRPAPTPPSLSASSTSAPPSSPTRTSRLRGLSYLMLGYTQNRVHPHTEPGNSQPPTSPARNSTSASARTSSTSPNSSVLHLTQPQQPFPDSHPSAVNTDCSSNCQSSSAATGGRLPTVAGRSAHSRIKTQATSDPTSPPSNELTGNTGNHTNFFASLRRTRSGSAPLIVQDGHNGNMQNHRSADTNGEAGQKTLELPPAPANEETGSSDPSARGNMSHTQLPSIRFVPHHDPRSTRPSLVFSPISRTLPTLDAVIRVGRYSERDTNVNPALNTPSSAPVGYKSKVVSRRHCEFWCTNGQWFIKDVRSSSGTFLNHIRLSSPGVESRPWPVNDGDVVQLGIDFRGGEEMIFRCVKIRVECNRGWQKGLNSFNLNTHKRLRNLGKAVSGSRKDGDNASTHTSECSICLMSIAPCQSLFVAPCSHVWHYKCIRQLLTGANWPSFLCPNCRAMADLDAEVDDPYAFEQWEEEAAQDAKVGEGEVRPQSNGRGAEVDAANHVGILNEANRLAARAPDAPVSETTRPGSPGDRSGGFHDADHEEALATMIGGVALTSDQEHQEQDDGSTGQHPSSRSSLHLVATHVEPTDIASGTSNSSPVPITTQTTKTHQESVPRTGDLDPTPNAANSHPRLDSSVDALGSEGPMTPRNDVGPFVFDGSAGRASGRRVAASLDDATADMDQAKG
ncbi:hypothetical protein FGG08_000293 [Glutinoglossum americanum]|uniref:RING-type E3 ubiquitin transferase n=1 Tax=Glutinoglossum americanum TaxID=1670608 RepID=A0A9P8I9E5_9PEZI|nr:hypothetical protein FGG08_000293 [Glutinoglossum americanum]